MATAKKKVSEVVEDVKEKASDIKEDIEEKIKNIGVSGGGGASGGAAKISHLDRPRHRRDHPCA